MYDSLGTEISLEMQEEGTLRLVNRRTTHWWILLNFCPMICYSYYSKSTGRKAGKSSLCGQGGLGRFRGWLVLWALPSGCTHGVSGFKKQIFLCLLDCLIWGRF